MHNVPQISALKKTITALSAILVLFVSSGNAYADQFDDQIAAARQEASAAASTAANFRAQADDAQAKINQLNAQIRLLQSQINLTQAESNKTASEIDDAKAKLAHQKDILGEIVKSMYFDSTISPIEMLASSSNISEFLDAEQYRESVKSKIQSAMTEIQTLKKTLEDKQTQLTTLLSDQKGRQQAMDSARAEANQLLALAQQNASAADAQVKNSNAQIATLKAQQQAILMAKYGNSLTGGATCGGGYPGYLCNAAQDSVVDPWGMYNRECVSYTAFKVAASGRRMPYWGGHGNANQWPDSARNAGIAVDGEPQVGDVAISLAGPYGHAMYVEGVSGGRIHVSQYNYGTPGTYSEMTISASGLSFIHFR